MISIIICSKNDVFYNNLIKNISSTIGIENYEIIKINNKHNEYSIIDAYNYGLKTSKFNYVLLIHEDVIFNTLNWGFTLLNYLKNKKYNLIGVAGAKNRYPFPSAWWHIDKKHQIQYINQINNNKEEFKNYGFDNNSTNVVFLDGVFLSFKKSDCNFIPNYINGFHNYDSILSLYFNEKKLNINVLNDILITHLSIGNINKDWYNSTFNFYFKNIEVIPNYYNLEYNNLRGKEACKRFIINSFDLRLFEVSFKTLKYVLKLNFDFKFKITLILNVVLKAIKLPFHYALCHHHKL